MLLKSRLELIGNTPLLELSRIKIANNNRIFAKLESCNPAGGVKDRVALHIFKRLSKENKLHKDSVIIEATAGNTGLGIAFVAQHFNVKTILVIPDKFSIEKQILAKALGAEVINTPKELGMQGAIDKANELLQNTPFSFTLNQFENPQNPQAHYLTTAAEIYEDMQELARPNKALFDYFVCGAGSGGSFSGCMRYFKEKDARIQGVLCDPIGSIIGGEGECCLNDIEGIGNNMIPKTMDTSLVSMVQKISNEEAYKAVNLLSQNEGVLAGISSGACLCASLKLAKSVKDSFIVTIFADDLSRYFSKNFLENHL